MNLDELLRAVWTQEAIGNAASNHNHYAPGSSLKRQSNFSPSRDRSKKTVEAGVVWREIQQGKRIRNHGDGNQERQNTLGEMIVVESDDGSNSNALNDQWTQYQMIPSLLSNLMQNQHIQLQPNSASRRGVTLADSGSCDTQAFGSKRVVCGDMVERKKKRMMKNRESAARSRARKQAYTQELEAKVCILEEENARLSRLMDLEKLLPFAPPHKPKYQLRRTSSVPF